jgi:hypothetical protein
MENELVALHQQRDLELKKLQTIRTELQRTEQKLDDSKRIQALWEIFNSKPVGGLGVLSNRKQAQENLKKKQRKLDKIDAKRNLDLFYGERKQEDDTKKQEYTKEQETVLQSEKEQKLSGITFSKKRIADLDEEIKVKRKRAAIPGAQYEDLPAGINYHSFGSSTVTDFTKVLLVVDNDPRHTPPHHYSYKSDTFTEPDSKTKNNPKIDQIHGNFTTPKKWNRRRPARSHEMFYVWTEIREKRFFNSCTDSELIIQNVWLVLSWMTFPGMANGQDNYSQVSNGNQISLTDEGYVYGVIMRLLDSLLPRMIHGVLFIPFLRGFVDEKNWNPSEEHNYSYRKSGNHRRIKIPQSAEDAMASVLTNHPNKFVMRFSPTHPMQIDCFMNKVSSRSPSSSLVFFRIHVFEKMFLKNGEDPMNALNKRLNTYGQDAVLRENLVRLHNANAETKNATFLTIPHWSEPPQALPGIAPTKMKNGVFANASLVSWYISNHPNVKRRYRIFQPGIHHLQLLLQKKMEELKLTKLPRLVALSSYETENAACGTDNTMYTKQVVHMLRNKLMHNLQIVHTRHFKYGGSFGYTIRKAYAGDPFFNPKKPGDDTWLVSVHDDHISEIIQAGFFTSVFLKEITRYFVYIKNNQDNARVLLEEVLGKIGSLFNLTFAQLNLHHDNAPGGFITKINALRDILPDNLPSLFGIPTERYETPFEDIFVGFMDIIPSFTENQKNRALELLLKFTQANFDIIVINPDWETPSTTNITNFIERRLESKESLLKIDLSEFSLKRMFMKEVDKDLPDLDVQSLWSKIIDRNREYHAANKSTYGSGQFHMLTAAISETMQDQSRLFDYTAYFQDLFKWTVDDNDKKLKQEYLKAASFRDVCGELFPTLNAEGNEGCRVTKDWMRQPWSEKNTLIQDLQRRVYAMFLRGSLWDCQDYYHAHVSHTMRWLGRRFVQSVSWSSKYARVKKLTIEQKKVVLMTLFLTRSPSAFPFVDEETAKDMFTGFGAVEHSGILRMSASDPLTLLVQTHGVNEAYDFTMDIKVPFDTWKKWLGRDLPALGEGLVKSMVLMQHLVRVGVYKLQPTHRHTVLISNIRFIAQSIESCSQGIITSDKFYTNRFAFNTPSLELESVSEHLRLTGKPKPLQLWEDIKNLTLEASRKGERRAIGKESFQSCLTTQVQKFNFSTWTFSCFNPRNLPEWSVDDPPNTVHHNWMLLDQPLMSQRWLKQLQLKMDHAHGPTSGLVGRMLAIWDDLDQFLSPSLCKSAYRINRAKTILLNWMGYRCVKYMFQLKNQGVSISNAPVPTNNPKNLHCWKILFALYDLSNSPGVYLFLNPHRQELAGFKFEGSVVVTLDFNRPGALDMFRVPASQKSVASLRGLHKTIHLVDLYDVLPHTQLKAVPPSLLLQLDVITTYHTTLLFNNFLYEVEKQMCGEPNDLSRPDTYKEYQNKITLKEHIRFEGGSDTSCRLKILHKIVAALRVVSENEKGFQKTIATFTFLPKEHKNKLSTEKSKQKPPDLKPNGYIREMLKSVFALTPYTTLEKRSQHDKHFSKRLVDKSNDLDLNGYIREMLKSVFALTPYVTLEKRSRHYKHFSKRLVDKSNDLDLNGFAPVPNFKNWKRQDMINYKQKYMPGWVMKDQKTQSVMWGGNTQSKKNPQSHPEFLKALKNSNIPKAKRRLREKIRNRTKLGPEEEKFAKAHNMGQSARKTPSSSAPSRNKKKRPVSARRRQNETYFEPLPTDNDDDNDYDDDTASREEYFKSLRNTDWKRQCGKGLFPAFEVVDGRVVARCGTENWISSAPFPNSREVDRLDEGNSNLLQQLENISSHWSPSQKHLIQLWRWLGVECLGMETYQAIADQFLRRKYDREDDIRSNKCKRRIKFLMQMLSSNILFPFVANQNEAARISGSDQGLDRVIVMLDWSVSGGLVLFSTLSKNRTRRVQRVQIEDLAHPRVFVPTQVRLHIFESFSGGIAHSNEKYYAEWRTSQKTQKADMNMRMRALQYPLPDQQQRELKSILKNASLFSAEKKAPPMKLTRKYQVLQRQSIIIQSSNLSASDIKLFRAILKLESSKVSRPDVYQKALELANKNLVSEKYESAKQYELVALCSKPEFVPYLRQKFHDIFPGKPMSEINRMTRAMLCQELLQVGDFEVVTRLSDLNDVPNDLRNQDTQLLDLWSTSNTRVAAIEQWLMTHYGLTVDDLKSYNREQDNDKKQTRDVSKRNRRNQIDDYNHENIQKLHAFLNNGGMKCESVDDGEDVLRSLCRQNSILELFRVVLGKYLNPQTPLNADAQRFTTDVARVLKYYSPKEKPQASYDRLLTDARTTVLSWYSKSLLDFIDDDTVKKSNQENGLLDRVLKKPCANKKYLEELLSVDRPLPTYKITFSILCLLFISTHHKILTIPERV